MDEETKLETDGDTNKQKENDYCYRNFKIYLLWSNEKLILWLQKIIKCLQHSGQVSYGIKCGSRKWRKICFRLAFAVYGMIVGCVGIIIYEFAYSIVVL